MNFLLGHEQGRSLSGSHSPLGCRVLDLPPGPPGGLEDEGAELKDPRLIESDTTV